MKPKTYPNLIIFENETMNDRQFFTVAVSVFGISKKGPTGGIDIFTNPATCFAVIWFFWLYLRITCSLCVIHKNEYRPKAQKKSLFLMNNLVLHRVNENQQHLDIFVTFKSLSVLRIRIYYYPDPGSKKIPYGS